MITAQLPGADLIETGLADLMAGSVTIDSLLVSITSFRRAAQCAR